VSASDEGDGAAQGVRRAVLTDIEGTTSSITFVKEVLFPFARRHLPAFVAARAADPEVRACLDGARAAAGDPGLSDEAVTARFLQWIDEDRKVTPLKTLQGRIWANGYATGELRSHVYDDAAEGLRAWRAAGHDLYVFSSGSIAAQKLLFAHTSHGDLTPLFSGYFDTTIGPKLENRSYSKIAASIGRPPGEVLFLSDHTGELDAAAAAGMRVACLDRGEVVIPPDTPHRRYRSFAEIDPERAGR
jgi:enolase-phosphatase E1